jgi:hypothetical protein
MEREEKMEEDEVEEEGLVRGGTVFFALMERAGASGRYQMATFVLWCMLVYTAGGLTLMPSFLFFQDPYHCEGSISVK